MSITAAGEELVHGKIPFYALKLRKEDGTSRIITSHQGRFISFRNDVARYEHEKMEVAVTVKPEKTELRWRISVKNRSTFPYLEPEYPSLGKYSIFPNMISSQFLAYIANGKGIYLGMHDEERTKNLPSLLPIW